MMVVAVAALLAHRRLVFSLLARYLFKEHVVVHAYLGFDVLSCSQGLISWITNYIHETMQVPREILN